ncbi:MAG: hypothetical protein AAB284_02600 [Chloroflexota bacterium]
MEDTALRRRLLPRAESDPERADLLSSIAADSLTATIESLEQALTLRPADPRLRERLQATLDAAGRWRDAGDAKVALSGDDGKADEVELAKSVVDEMRTFKALKVVGAFVAGRALGADDVQALAKLPPRAQLRATIVGILQAPLGSLTGLLQSPLGTLVHVLAARGSAAR